MFIRSSVRHQPPDNSVYQTDLTHESVDCVEQVGAIDSCSQQ